MSTTLQRAAALALVIATAPAVGALAETVAPDAHHPDTAATEALPSAEPGVEAEPAQDMQSDQPGAVGQGTTGEMMPPDMMSQGMMGEMMGQGMMGRGMMGEMMAQGMMQPGRTNAAPGMPGHMMKVMFAIADADGDGGLSFEEISTIQRRVFDVVDADQDGRMTVEELQGFMRE